MKRNSFSKHFLLQLAALFLLSGLLSCGNHQAKTDTSGADSDTIVMDIDTTFYGVCGEATTMNSICLITDMQDTLTFSVFSDDAQVVKGGLMAGDRLAIVAHLNDDNEQQADQVINLTTLLGKWMSIDRNFEIREGGVVEQQTHSEKQPWVAWKILNGRLLLNADTFQVNTLGPDSLELETPTGIFLYKRMKEEA